MKAAAPRMGRLLWVQNLLTALHRGVAFAAVDGTVILGLERHLGGGTAIGADGIVHHARTTGVPLGLVGHTAFTAASRLILETLFGVEFLLTGGEYKFLTAVTAHQRLVLIHSFA